MSGLKEELVNGNIKPVRSQIDINGVGGFILF